MLVYGKLGLQGKEYPVEFFVNSGAIGYSFIDRLFAAKVCEHLGMEPIPLIYSRKVRRFNGKLDPRSITYCIYLNLTIGGHKELTTPILITNLSSYAAILGKG